VDKHVVARCATDLCRVVTKTTLPSNCTHHEAHSAQQALLGFCFSSCKPVLQRQMHAEHKTETWHTVTVAASILGAGTHTTAPAVLYFGAPHPLTRSTHSRTCPPRRGCGPRAAGTAPAATLGGGPAALACRASAARQPSRRQQPASSTGTSRSGQGCRTAPSIGTRNVAFMPIQSNFQYPFLTESWHSVESGDSCMPARK
jgi:hypothetical protein